MQSTIIFVRSYDKIISANYTKVLSTASKRMLAYMLDRFICLASALNLRLGSTENRTHAAVVQRERKKINCCERRLNNSSVFAVKRSLSPQSESWPVHNIAELTLFLFSRQKSETDAGFERLMLTYTYYGTFFVIGFKMM